jgi:uncharacterized membrane protein YfcA
MDSIYIIVLMVTGGFAGFTGGMLGLGGAFIMTPIQYIVYTRLGLNDHLALMTSFGTSLLVVLSTAISGALRHHRAGAVLWKAAIIIGIVSSAVAFGGSTLSAHLPGEGLRIAFGILLLLAGIRMLTAGTPDEADSMVTRPWQWGIWAVPIGLVSGIFGVGGGVVMIPVFVLALRFPVHRAVGTSLAVMILASLGGITGYIVNGLGVAGRLNFSAGYVNFTSWMLLAVPAAAMAQVGAAAAHKLPRKPLLSIFIVILVFMSLRMIGVFDWLGWHI